MQNQHDVRTPPAVSYRSTSTRGRSKLTSLVVRWGALQTGVPRVGVDGRERVRVDVRAPRVGVDPRAVVVVDVVVVQ